MRPAGPGTTACAGTDSRLAQTASEALDAGEVIVIPTDTVYGLAAAVDRPDAISRLYALKGRPAEKAIPVLLSDASQVYQVATGLSKTAQLLASSFWPGALTIVLAARSDLPRHLTSISADGVYTVAVRVPDHPLTRSIIAAAGGALAVTSANRSGEQPALDAREAGTLQGLPPILVVDGGTATEGIPSTIVLAIGDSPRILREGAIPAVDIAAVLAKPAGRLSSGSEFTGLDRPLDEGAQQTSVSGTSE